MLWDELLNLEEAMARRRIELAVSLAFLHFLLLREPAKEQSFCQTVQGKSCDLLKTSVLNRVILLNPLK